MKIVYSIILFFLALSSIRAQTESTYPAAILFKAVHTENPSYRIYKDVKHEKNKLIKIDSLDQKVEIKLDENSGIWGYKDKLGNTYRIKTPKKSYLVLAFGGICIYLAKEVTRVNAHNPQDHFEVPKYAFSIGPNARIRPLNSIGLFKGFVTDTYPEVRQQVTEALTYYPDDRFIDGIIELNTKIKTTY